MATIEISFGSKILERVEMKIILDRTENRMSYLTVEAAQSEMEDYMEKVYQRLVKSTEVPGFDRGSTPRDALEEYLGRDKMIEEAVKEIASSIYPKVIKEHKLETKMQPLIKPDPENPLVFEMIVPLNPLVELCDYHNIKLEQEPLNISNEGVAEVLEKFRIQKAEHETADRPVQEGDLITIDIEGILSGSSFMHKKGVKFQVSSGFPPDIPGFYQEMIGISKGEEKKFELKLPDDYTDKVVAGKEVSFKVKVNDIQNTILPELNDEFANKVAPGIKTLASLRKRIETNMKKEQERNAESQFKEMVVKCVIEKSKLEYPPIVVDAEAQNLISEYMKQLQLSCKSSEEYEEKRKHVSEAKLKEWGRDTAERRVLWSLVLNEVAKSENIDVDDWEIEEEIEHMISGADEEREKQREGLSSYQNRQNVYSLLKARKTVNRLAEIVKTANN